MPSIPYGNQKKTINYYGVFTLWAAILLVASYAVLYTSGCGEIGSVEIPAILAHSIVTGVLLFLLSFANIAIRLFHRKCIFYFIVLLLVCHVFLLLYISYATLGRTCELTLYYERNLSVLKNVTGAHEQIRKTFASMNRRRNDHYAVSSLLDLIGALLYGASAYAFRHRF